MLEQGTISIHTENIFPIIKKALYSERDIFLRELISNAVDATTKLKMVSYAGEEPIEVSEPEIEIVVDRDRKTIAVSDNGIGMTADEVKKYINQVAFSSAEEFIHKYAGAANEQQIIGHFGLGFYSAFMVSSRVEIDTRSYRSDAQAVHWSCDGTTAFTLDDGTRETVGTTVTLNLQEDAEEFLEVAEIRRIIRNYCDFIPVPIKLNGEVINKQKALWAQAPSSITSDEYLEFYRYLYPFQEDPLFWIHLNTDYPFIIKGILYFPKIKADIDPTKGQIKLFCNQVFVSDNCEEIIPRFLLPLRGAIDSTDIPLNVSRSFLQGDRKVRKIQEYIAKKVGDYLTQLYADNREEFLRCWKDISLFMKFGSMNNDKFYQQVKEILVYPTTYSDPATGDAEKQPNYTTLQAYLERNESKHQKRVFYTSDPVAQSTYVELHKSQGLEVITLDSFIDNHFVHFLEREFSDVKFTRVDAEIDDSLIGKEANAELVDPQTNKTKSDTIQDIFRRALNKPKLTIRTEALKDESPSAPPAMILLPEASRRMQEMTALLQQTSAAFPEDHILLVNTSHPLMQNLLSLDRGMILTASGQASETQELANMICSHIYDLALMAQKSFDADGMKTFLERSNQLLTRLTK